MRTGLPAPPEDPLGPYGGVSRGPWGAQRAPKGAEAGAREIRTRALSEGLPRAPRSPGSLGARGAQGFLPRAPGWAPGHLGTQGSLGPLRPPWGHWAGGPSRGREAPGAPGGKGPMPLATAGPQN